MQAGAELCQAQAGLSQLPNVVMDKSLKNCEQDMDKS